MADLLLVKGCCPLDCQDSCAWVAEVQDGSVTAVRGARDHPFTRGVLCAKVNDYQARTYAPDRLLAPLRRTGKKGRGQFEPISWDAALDLIAERILEIVARHGGEALLPHHYLGSMGVVQRRALMRIFHALGASRIHGSICGASGNVVAAEGMPRGFDPEDIVHSRLVLVWGANLLTTSHHHWHFIEQARRRNGARVICIDPRRTRTARACDEHLPIRPASDAALAAGMARIMFEEGLADLDFANSVAADLDAYRRTVAPWTPERVSEATGLPAETVIGLARSFGHARPAVIRSGIAPQQTIHGETYVRALGALAILGGHWRRPGGGLFIETGPDLDELRAECPELATAATRSLDRARLGRSLTDPGLNPPIKALMVWCTNPAVVQIEAGLVRQGLACDDLFTVVIEHFLTDTARFADLVLPSTTQLEHFDIQGAWGHHYIAVNQPAIPPLGEAKSHGEILRLLAPRLGLHGPTFEESDEAIAASALPEGVSLAQLKEAGWIKRAPKPPGFAARLQLAETVPAAMPPSSLLRLLTPKSHFFLNSSFVNMPRQRKAQGGPRLEMHPADAERRDLKDGEAVRITNECGAIAALLRLTDAVCEGVVSLEGKWWGEPAEEGPVANLLSAPRWSPGGQPAYNDIFVQVSAARPGASEIDLAAAATA